jgi:hypothetical protein
MTGLELVPAIVILTTFTAIAIGVSTYVFLLYVLKDSLFASLGSLLIIAGNLAMFIYHKPGPTAIMFAVLFFAILLPKGRLESPPRILVALLLLMGATVTHFTTAMLFFFILLGLWGFALLRRQQAWPGPPLTVLALFLVIPVVWILYWGTPAFNAILPYGAAALFDPLATVRRLVNVFAIGQANFGETAPDWYRLTRLVWLALLYVAGGVIWLWSLRRFRRLSPTEISLVGAISGLVLIGLASSVTSSRGFAELLRWLTWVPFFTTPLLLLGLAKMKPNVSKVGVAALAVLLVAISLPSFLANNGRINSTTSHQIEFAAGESLRSLYGTGSGLTFFSTGSACRSVQFYVYSATYETEWGDELFDAWTEDSLWQAMDQLLSNFERSSETGRDSLYIHSPKEALDRSMRFNIPFDHPRWAAMAKRLSERNNRAYDNGPIQIFSS